MLNSFCHRETLLQVRAAAGRIFMLCPDYSFAAILPTAIPSWLFVDEPLHLAGFFPEGIGATQGYNRGEPAREFEREFKEDVLLKRVPLKAALQSNYITETLLISKERLPKLSGYDVDWMQYFLSCWNDIMVLKQHGIDVSADKAEFRRVLAEHPSDLRERVGAVTNYAADLEPAEEWRLRHPLRASIRKAINNSTVLTTLESLVRRRSTNPQVPGDSYLSVRGEVAGFGNILECARQLPELARAASAQQPAAAR